MKKLYFFILLFCLGFSKTGNAQGVLDDVKFTPGYICQVDSFSISMWVWVSSQPGQIDSVVQFFRNDTLHLDGYVTGGPLAAITKVYTNINVPTPPPGQYSLFFQRHQNIGSGTYMLYGSHTDSFSVCLGALAVPESTAKNQRTTEVYPNPTSDLITIQLPETKGQTVAATLSDVTGKKMLSQSVNSANQTNQIDISALPAGVYFLQLQTKENFKIVKVIKQ